MPIFDQTCGITPLEKCHFFDEVKMTFLWPKKPCFLFKTASNYLSWYFGKENNF